MPVVKLFASLRTAAGVKEITIAGTTLARVVSELVKQYPALAEKLLDQAGIRPHVTITINGHPTTDAELEVTEEDRIAIFPPISGG